MGDTLLYHEKQESALCGVHTLNTLLQGSYFSEIDLAQIAQELDALEHAFMLEGGVDSKEFKDFLAEESGNVAENGMFSIQVLSKALEVWNLQVVALDSPDVKEIKADPTRGEAFICNLQEHWFSLRVIDGEWWNFNSLFPAPQPLSAFYLAAFLDSLKAQGYTIFAVLGALPRQNKSAEAIASSSSSSGLGRWFTPDQAKVLNDDAARARQRGRITNALENTFAQAAAQGGTLQLRTRAQARAAAVEQQQQGDSDMAGDGPVGDDEDADLAAAIAASLQHTSGPGGAPTSGAGAGASPGVGARDYSPSSSQGQLVQHEDDDDRPGTMQGGALGFNPADYVGYVDGGVGDAEFEDDDPELAAAIAASLADAAGPGADASEAAGASPAQQPVQQPPQPVQEPLQDEPPAEDVASSSAVELAFRLPTGTRASRRFPLAAPSSQLYAYISQVHGLAPAAHKIVMPFPRKVLPDDASAMLQSLGLEHRMMLNVEKSA